MGGQGSGTDPRMALGVTVKSGKDAAPHLQHAQASLKENLLFGSSDASSTLSYIGLFEQRP